MYVLIINGTAKEQNFGLEMVINDAALEAGIRINTHETRIMALDRNIRPTPNLLILEIDRQANIGYVNLCHIQVALPDTPVLVLLHPEATPDKDIRAEQVNILNLRPNVTAVDAGSDVNFVTQEIKASLQRAQDHQNYPAPETPQILPFPSHQ